MSKIYWDTMLFVYWLEDREPQSTRISNIYRRMEERGDQLCTSVFALAELLVGPVKAGDAALKQEIIDFFSGPDVDVLPFGVAAAMQYADIRALHKVSPADAIHLSCAASAKVDLFLTNDLTLRRVSVPGIQFIDGIETTALGST